MTGICFTHGRVMLHNDPCKECRYEIEQGRQGPVTPEQLREVLGEPLIEKNI